VLSTPGRQPAVTGTAITVDAARVRRHSAQVARHVPIRGSGWSHVGLPPGRHQPCGRRPSREVLSAAGARRNVPARTPPKPAPTPLLITPDFVRVPSPEVVMAVLLFLLAIAGGVLVGDLGPPCPPNSASSPTSPSWTLMTTHSRSR
jgi:hypothetical protein